MEIILRKEGSVVLLEAPRAKLGSNPDDLLSSVSSIVRIMEKIVRVIDLVDQVASETDRVQRQNLGKRDLVAKHVAVRIVPLVHLWAAVEGIVVAPVKTANVIVPGRVLERARVAQEQSLARIRC
jgi:hypothetical protein